MLLFNNKYLLLHNIIRVFFFGNIFLGICAVTLCVETDLLLNIPLNSFPFYIFIFFCTCIYYTMIYVRSAGAKSYNDRTIWYRNNIITIKKILTVSVVITIASAVILLTENIAALTSLTSLQVTLSVIFPFIAAWYTFMPSFFKIKKIRHTGWIKPFIVGATWAGLVTVYPVLIWQARMGNASPIDIVAIILLLLQNFLFCSTNAIIFDIKDFRTDSFNRLNTYPVIFGIRNTFRFIIFPVVALDYIVFFLFQQRQQYSVLQTFIQLIPHLLLIFVILNHRQQRSVLYYLAAVDGLVFVKAFCGITSIFLKK